MSRARRNWTEKEDNLLRDLVQKELEDDRPVLWRELAKHIPGRSNKDCRKRWWNSLAGGTVKGAWSPEEDQRLTDAVKKFGTNWPQVAAVVGSRCGDQCSSHWRQVLNPDINYCDWTGDEDEKLLAAVHTYGTNWSRIASFHEPQRTTLALKNRYWKLRLKSQSGTKSPSTKSPSQPAVKMKTQQGTLKLMRTAAPDESDDDDDDDGDEGGRYEFDESDSEEMDLVTDMNARYDELPHSQTEWASSCASPSKANAATTPRMCMGYLDVMVPKDRIQLSNSALEGQWMEGMAAHMTSNTSTPLYLNDGFLGPTEHDSANQDYTSIPSVAQRGEGSMDMDFSNLTESLGLGSHAFKGYDVSVGQKPSFSFPVANQSMGNSGIIPIDPSVTDTALKEKSSERVSHQVSINFSCTTGELSNIMCLLASIGLVVNMKIDTQ
ncbi:hypothetical protein BKA67DRAFT_653500 [Truncatella angustata]|uniref:Uncharacterized protein n=1 Tax=Truncatella angustata TaxID=152316 RepID=A0A9P8UY14_9PEZI|nr:uncharacterized protein BKA67DRAFT_653500 [Truncatella angustata]KAH6660307.1 hypothetical protein BKA67DRAFT_653500 [Truncatella angustata]